ncbi:protein STRUBBELIG-receptor FAMILY 8 [Dorcoceras hygrometricum]|uniref:Protein STRUBBELIG-receptor FAMILY 8 n=1 Tax=Dorcoceras hygrometricum TaxID=472368 RepID=A0A2Z7A3X6_9LAMI|nr:protein STRUBBELIG-receptor FAMILY 8 [Dorcoceras hygrometricum]
MVKCTLTNPPSHRHCDALVMEKAVASFSLFLTRLPVIWAVIFSFSVAVNATTDPNDVQGLQVLYTSLNNPWQLTGWRSSGGDPCGELWKGVICQGSSVVSLQISGLGLSGTMGYLLNNLVSLTTFDLSGNNIHDSIPYQLPPNLTSLNLARNNISGNLPYSLSSMTSLDYLNVSRNFLSQGVGDMFANHSALANFRVQNNKLTGSLNVLVGLPLIDLNVANNNFSGWIPQELSSLTDFVYDGNAFANGPAPPPPPYTPPPPGRSSNNRTPQSGHTPESNVSVSNAQNGHKKNALPTGSILGLVIGSLFAMMLLLLALVFCLRKGSKKEITARTSVGSLPGSDKVNAEMQEHRAKPTATVSDLKPTAMGSMAVERLQGKNGSVKRVQSPITATSFTVAILQTATNSFSQENLIGEGSLGRVYRAEFPNGKIMAIKKIDSAALSLQEEDNFLEAISNMSRLRHPNIVGLVGYCAEHGQRLLVHDFIGNGSLHDTLHYADERSKMLTWNARVRVALGTARALEYLHEVCLPSVVHRNLKSANILLDDEFNPHLSDCGLASLTPNTERQVSSDQMIGSFGYSAPEFALSGIYTVKSDVYSFGVVMLELLTGRKPLDVFSSRVRSEQSLVRWATPQLHDIDALAKMVDPILNGMYPAKSLSRFADIIALCVQPEPEFRPPMSEVVQALVRLMQRAVIVKRQPSEDSGFAFRNPDHEAGDLL